VRAIATLEASASWGGGTTARNAPLLPAWKKTEAVVSAKATARTSQNAAWWVSTATARTPTADAPRTSEAIIRRRRSTRSAATPLAALNRRVGASSTAPT